MLMITARRARAFWRAGAGAVVGKVGDAVGAVVCAWDSGENVSATTTTAARTTARHGLSKVISPERLIPAARPRNYGASPAAICVVGCMLGGVAGRSSSCVCRIAEMNFPSTRRGVGIASSVQTVVKVSYTSTFRSA